MKAKVLLLCLGIFFFLVTSTSGQYRESDVPEAARKKELAAYKAKIKAWEKKQIVEVKKVSNPYLVKSTRKNAKPVSAYWWILAYDDPFTTFELFVIVIMPMVLGRVIHYIMKQYRPAIKHKREDVSEFPLIPLVYLQATVGERQMKNEKRNGLHWLAGKYIVNASDEYVNLNIGGKHYQQIMKIKKKPWKLVRRIVSMHGWFRRAQQRIALTEAGQEIPESLKPLRLQRRPTIFKLLREQEQQRRAQAKSLGIELQGLSMYHSSLKGSFYNPGESRALQVSKSLVSKKRRRRKSGISQKDV